jgi:hypothetical protein
MKNLVILCAALAILCCLPACASSCKKTASCASCSSSKDSPKCKAQ